MNWMPLVTGVAALLLALALTPVVRSWAINLGLCSQPRADRWNQRVVAMLGGVAIVTSVLVACLPVVTRLGSPGPLLLLTGLAMALVGYYDDRKEFRPELKLIAQILLAIVMVVGGLRIGLPQSWPVVIDPLLTLFWLVAITNAFNLLDNMDGLCAGIASVAGLVLAVIAMKTGSYALAAVCTALVGACLGYLKYNKHPATIFMGDCGSLFLGHMLAGAALLMPGAGGSGGFGLVLAVPALVMLIPLFDTTIVSLSRPWFKRRITQGGRDHMSHRLVAIGMSEPAAVRLLWILAGAGGFAAIMLLYLDWWLAVPIGLTVILITALLAWYLLRVRIYEETDSLTQVLDRASLPLLGEHRYRRRVGEVLFDTVGIGLGLFIAFVLRYEGRIVQPELQTQLVGALPLVVGIHLVIYALAGVYRGIWRFTSVVDLPRFVFAVVMGSVVSGLVLHLLGNNLGGSSTILVINGLLQMFMLAGTRVTLRLIRDMLRTSSATTPALMVGTSERAESLLRHFLYDRQASLRPIGLVSEHTAQVGLRLLGVSVLCTAVGVREHLLRTGAKDVVLLDDHFPVGAWTEILEVCAELGINARTYYDELLTAGAPVPPPADDGDGDGGDEPAEDAPAPAEAAADLPVDRPA